MCACFHISFHLCEEIVSYRIVSYRTRPAVVRALFRNWLLLRAIDAQGDYNVVIVDYEERSKNLSGPQLLADGRAVGKEIGIVAANILVQAKSDMSKLYCVGHSLGAHVCGYAGMTTKFGRITGQLCYIEYVLSES